MEIAKDSSGANQTAWFKGIKRANYPALTDHLTTEVCIIGAGITGLTTAYRLLSEGKSVIVLEDGKIASGESGRTSAHLTYILDDHYFEIEKVHGEEIAALVAQSHAAAIDFIETVSEKEKINCEFKRVNGYLVPHDESAIKILKKEFATTHKLGLSPKMLTRSPAHTFAMSAALRFLNQAEFHPLKYLVGIAEKIIEKGGKIFENTHAKKFTKDKTIHVTTNTGGTITADFLIIATNVPVNDRVVMHTKLEPKRTYIIGSLIPQNSVESALYWDTADPYRYVRVHKGDYEHNDQICDLLIIGGEDHRVAEPPKNYNDCYNKLESWAQKFFPQRLKNIYHWSGQIIEPIDYLAFIGHNPLDLENVFIAGGDSGNGLTHGTLAGILLSDLVLQRNNPWKKVYEPSRKKLKAWKEFAKTNLASVLTYLNYLKPEITDVRTIQAGEGAIIRRGVKKMAVYRDHKGKLHECSAVCPHLKSLVRWNSTEKTWDCPAHGSRFTGEGCVINGPANNSLRKKK